jgi:hypothetical protein
MVIPPRTAGLAPVVPVPVMAVPVMGPMARVAPIAPIGRGPADPGIAVPPAGGGIRTRSGEHHGHSRHRQGAEQLSHSNLHQIATCRENAARLRSIPPRAGQSSSRERRIGGMKTGCISRAGTDREALAAADRDAVRSGRLGRSASICTTRQAAPNRTVPAGADIPRTLMRRRRSEPNWKTACCWRAGAPRVRPVGMHFQVSSEPSFTLREAIPT